MTTNENIAPLVASPKAVGRMIDSGLTRVYELINSGEIQSYRDGKARKIIVASVEAYVERQLGLEGLKEQRGWTERATQARIKKRKLAPPAHPSRQMSTPPVTRTKAADRRSSDSAICNVSSKQLDKP